jgi:methylated-DNA-[protein]-cysteine S-methyltransferase
MKSKITAFQASVYDAVRLIPRGKVTTYRLLADYLGCRSCRAVGQALKRNPFAPEVPCHRVIASDMSIGGFNGSRSGPDIQRKMDMLLEEGLDLQGGSLTDTAMLYTFSASQ